MARAARRVSIRFNEGRGKLDRRRARGMLNPCARESKARIGEFSEGEADLRPRGLLSSYESQRTSEILGEVSGMHRALVGWMLVRAPASTAQGLHHHGPRYFDFPYFCMTCGLEKLGFVDQN